MDAHGSEREVRLPPIAARAAAAGATKDRHAFRDLGVPPAPCNILRPSDLELDEGGRRYIAVLGVPPINRAVDAVRAAVVPDIKSWPRRPTRVVPRIPIQPAPALWCGMHKGSESAFVALRDVIVLRALDYALLCLIEKRLRLIPKEQLRDGSTIRQKGDVGVLVVPRPYAVEWGLVRHNF
jgi:hypothetical protein